MYADEEEECETGLNPFLLAATAAIAAGGAFLIFNQVTGGKKKRSVSDVFSSTMELMSRIFGQSGIGLEDFEGKIEKIAGGVDKDENSWLNKLYKQYHGESLAETLEGDTLAEENEDEMALSNDEHESAENRAFRKKRSDEEVVKKEEEDIEAIFNSVESSCSTKFWRCVSNVIEGGLHYTEMPGGLTGAMKKHLMKVVFAGGISNMWDSLMTVPEARKFQKCMAKQTECTEYEILQKALNSEKALPQRVLVVPETIKVEEEPEE